jgi:DNA invertase Pin-like site-specific DNA recombinase
MKKVVLFIRKSTLQQEYDHQENLLIDVCKKNDWEIVSTIRETISGTKRNEDRIGIGQLKNVVLELKPDIKPKELSLLLDVTKMTISRKLKPYKAR